VVYSRGLSDIPQTFGDCRQEQSDHVEMSEKIKAFIYTIEQWKSSIIIIRVVNMSYNIDAYWFLYCIASCYIIMITNKME